MGLPRFHSVTGVTMALLNNLSCSGPLKPRQKPMAQRISMTHGKTGLREAVPIGFSWTTLFFGFFVPLIRGDIRWAAIMFAVAIVVLVAGVFVVGVVAAETGAPGVILLLSFAGPLVVNVVFATRCNTVCAAGLVERGFKPTGALGRRLLAAPPGHRSSRPCARRCGPHPFWPARAE